MRIPGSRRSLARYVAAAIVAMAIGCQPGKRPSEEVASIPPPKPTAKVLEFEATAYSVEGKTASGGHTRAGIVAADPKMLPIGSRVRVTDAQGNSGTYVVADTGRTIKGREIDIYMASAAEAKRFGRRKVKVEILRDAR